jgi:beta-glucosidase-like glycosyl hydrolase
MAGFLMLASMFASMRLELPYMDNCTIPSIFCDATKDADARASDLVQRLTLSEKIAQLSTNSFSAVHAGFTPGVPRLGVSAYNYHTEGLHGVRDMNVAGFHNSTLFPQVTAMAATGNFSLVFAMATVMAKELRAANNAMRSAGLVVARGGGLSLYGPTINIIRDGRWGRNEETVSEDPWLAGQYADAFVRGVQGEQLSSGTPLKYLAAAATCKHLAAYSVETDRHDMNVNVSELDLHETYLPAFQACVAAGAAQIMCSYNQINGVPACLHGDLQNRLARGVWRFNGSIVSDCDAISDITTAQHLMGGAAATAAGIRQGCDQDCGVWYSTYAAEALSTSSLQLTESNIDVSLARIFRMRFLLGEMGDNPRPFSTIGAGPSSEATRNRQRALYNALVTALPPLGGPAR